MSKQELITQFQCPKCLQSFETEKEQVCCPNCGYSATGYDLRLFLRKYQTFKEDNITETTKLSIIKVRKQNSETFYLIRSDNREIELSPNSCLFTETELLFIDKVTENPSFIASLTRFAIRKGLPLNCPLEEPEATCPECGSTKTWKAGLRYTKQGKIQRYYCRECGFRFSASETINRTSAQGGTRQICASQTKAVKIWSKWKPEWKRSLREAQS